MTIDNEKKPDDIAALCETVRDRLAQHPELLAILHRNGQRLARPYLNVPVQSLGIAELLRAQHASMHVLVSSDVHIAAVSGGGRSTPIVEDYARYYAIPKHLVTCAERPNTTDMFRMFRDNRNKPKRGKK